MLIKGEPLNKQRNFAALMADLTAALRRLVEISDKEPSLKVVLISNPFLFVVNNPGLSDFLSFPLLLIYFSGYLLLRRTLVMV